MFPIDVLWIFLSLRYGADLRRSRLVFSSDYNSHTDRSFLETILKPPEHLRPSPAKGDLVQRVPLSFFHFFRETYKTCLKGPPLDFFRHCATFFSKKILMSQKGPPSSFFIFCNWMYVNKSQRVPLLHFSALCDFFFERIFFFKNYKFFSKKIFCSFWALDMAPTLDVLVLFLQTTILTLIGPLFRNNPKTTWAPEAKSG